jgi:hypothetical protein
LKFGLTNLPSFESIPHLVNTVNALQAMSDLFLVGNQLGKSDERKITFPDGLTLAEKIDAKYCETSAETGYCVDDLFAEITTDLAACPSQPKWKPESKMRPDEGSCLEKCS